MKSQRSPIIEFPLSIILTAEGEYFFDKNNHAAGTLKALRSKDQSKLSLTSYSARNLQWLITAGYVSQIEVLQTDFNSKRGELMDLANLISYGVLWKNYAIKLFRALKNTPLISQWNRRHPANSLDQNTMIQADSWRHQSPAQAPAFQEEVRDITRGTFDHYKKMMTDLTEEEKEILQRKSENYLGLINPLIWTLIAKNRNTPAYEQIAKDIRGTLWSYLQKTNIADYLGLMILELASMTEKNLLRKAVSTYLHGKVDLDHFMKSKRDRTKILEILRARNDYTSLIWRLQGRHPSISESRPFCFVMTNHNAEAESVLESLEGRKNLETGGRNLAEFCEAQGVQDSDQELGLFYLNYLQEECRQQGTLLSSYTSQNSQHNSFLVTLSIRF